MGDNKKYEEQEVLDALMDCLPDWLEGDDSSDVVTDEDGTRFLVKVEMIND